MTTFPSITLHRRTIGFMKEDIHDLHSVSLKKKKTKPKRLPRSEQAHTSTLSSGRATLPVRGTLTISVVSVSSIPGPVVQVNT